MVQAPPNTNTRKILLPRGLWITWMISMVLLTLVGGMLLITPASAQSLWPWPLAPFNTRLLGAVYASAVLPLLGYCIKPRPQYVAVLLPVFASLTTYCFWVSVGYSDSFLSRKSSAVWFFLYGADSFAGLYFCWRMRSLLTQTNSTLSWSVLYRVQSVVLAAYGMALLLFPDWVGRAWIWPLDRFHSHLYAGVFGVAALAMELLRDRGSRIERLWFAGTQLCLGLLVTITTWRVDLTVNKLDWLSVWPWFWQSIFLIFACFGGWILITESRGWWRER